MLKRVKKKKFLRLDITIHELIRKELKIRGYDYKMYSIFMKKFLGMFIYKGNKYYAVNALDYFFENMKNELKQNPHIIFFNLVRNVLPFISLGSKKTGGKKAVYSPVVLKSNKPNLYALNWLVRQFKYKSNIRGVNLKDVLKVLIDTYKFKGSALQIKREHYLEAVKWKHLLRKKKGHMHYIRLWQKDLRRKKAEDSEKEFFKKRNMTEDEIVVWKSEKAPDSIKWRFNWYIKRRRRKKKKNPFDFVR